VIGAVPTVPIVAVRTDRVARPLPTVLMHSVVVRFMAFGLNAVTGIITARALNPTGRGEMAAVVLWPALLAGLTTLGLPSALTYHVRRTPDRAAVLVGAALAMCVGTGLVGTVVAWYFVPLWLRQQPASIVAAAQYCLLTITMCSLTLTGRAAWEARGHFAQSNLSQLVLPVVIIGALIPLAHTGRLTPRVAAAVYVLAGYPVLIWILVSVARIYRPTVRGAGAVWTRLLHYGCRSYGVDLCGVLAVYLDQALVVGLLLPEAMGLYVVALNLSKVINAVSGSLAMIMFPKVVGLSHDDLTASIARSARLGALVSSAFGLLIVAAGPMLMTRLYGPAYEPAGRLLPLLVLQVILAGVSQVLLQGFLAANRPGVATLVQFVGLGLSVPLFVTWVSSSGAFGAASALLASTFLRLLLMLLCYPVFLGVAIPRVWIGVRDVADLAAYRWAIVESLPFLRSGAAK
jgi:O-antigen/teichoic acid export membrane protein